MNQQTKDLIMNKKVIAICRGIYGDDLRALADALFKGGIEMIEVTFDQKDPDHLHKTQTAIRMLKDTFQEMAVGAGTVISLTQLQYAYEGGAQYIISPNTDLAVIRETKRLGLLSIPGAMTPSDIVSAYQNGADFVKLFPCAQLGTSYVKAIRSPLNHIPLLATGGITPDNLEEYLSLGMAGAGMGGNLCSKALLKEKKFDELTAIARSCSAIAARY